MCKSLAVEATVWLRCKNANTHLSDVKVNELLGLVGHVAAKLAPYKAVPAAQEGKDECESCIWALQVARRGGSHSLSRTLLDVIPPCWLLFVQLLPAQFCITLATCGQQGESGGG